MTLSSLKNKQVQYNTYK